MSYIFSALSDFFTTAVGGYWTYVYIGIGVVLCIKIIIDELR